ncbi:MAG: CoA transferase [Clostridia bacterium]|nr:CoA transferase [Clostridia bacterium]
MNGEVGRRRGPLQGVTVVELGSLIAGPFCGRLLGDLGARVIKVEPPGKGDPLREWSLVTDHGSLWSMVQSRNKESVAVDLRREAGQALVRRLLTKADLVVENFRPGRLEAWRLGPDDVWPLHPRLIYVRISGFGQTGPYRDRPGFGSIAEAMGGLRYITGFPDRPPLRVGVSLGDAVAALYAAMGALAALWRRRETGRGEVVDVALYEAVFSLLESILPEYGYAGLVRERQGNALLGAAPSNTYRTRDGIWMTIGANADSIFRRFAQAIGRPELPEDPRFRDNQARRAHVDELDAIIQDWVGRHDAGDVWKILNEAGVPAGPVYSVKDIAEDPQYRARAMILPVEVPGVGTVLMPGVVPRFAREPGGVDWPGPRLGEHTRKVLEGDLGLGGAEVDRLARDGVIQLADVARAGDRGHA